MDIIKFIDEHLNKHFNKIEDEFTLKSHINNKKEEITKLINTYLKDKFNDEDIIKSYKHLAKNYLSDYFKKLIILIKKK